MWFQAWQEAGEQPRALPSERAVGVQVLFGSGCRGCGAVSSLAAGIPPGSAQRGRWVLGTNSPGSPAGITATQPTTKNTSGSLGVLSETAKRGIT